MSRERIHLGISTCPNDTFTFHALMEGRVDLRGFDFEVELLDVQELNQRLLGGDFQVAKASFHAALLMSETLGVLPVGSALGFGVGPLLLGARAGLTPEREVDGRPPRILCPGATTTATLLLRLFHPKGPEPEQVVFSEIMPALETGAADLGVCIHEGRFTWEQRGLHRVEDLGATWEAATESPLPLGGILARHDLGEERHARLRDVLRDSLRWARRHPERTLPTMRRHAQELDEPVIWSHVELYVNGWTEDLGAVGRQALHALSERARDVGIVSPDTPRLQILAPFPDGLGADASPAL